MSTRTLPIRLAPLPGEALDSWLEATAHRCHARLINVVGMLAAGDLSSADPDRWTVYLPPQTAVGIAAATGVPLDQLRSMSLGSYDGIALRIDAVRRTVSRHRLWGRTSGSRFCPDCLAATGGRWQLWWRLGWAFACPQHHQLLADTCPSCHRPARRQVPARHVIPQPGRCAHAARGRTGMAEARCGADLTTAAVLRLPEDHPALAVQKALLDTINSGAAEFGVYLQNPQPAVAALADMRAVAGRILNYATPQELSAVVPADLLGAVTEPFLLYQASRPRRREHRRSGFMAPAQASTTATGLTAAWTVLGAPDFRAAGAALRWLVTGSRRDGVNVGTGTITKWGRDTSPALTTVQLAALEPLLPAIERLHFRTTTGHPRYPTLSAAAVERRAQCVPTLFWPFWSLRLHLPKAGLEYYRLALSNAVLLAGTRLRVPPAIRLLQSPTRAHNVGRFLQLMRSDPQWDQLATALIRLADYLDAHGSPVDYRRRRRLVYDALLPDEVWIRRCRELGRPVREGGAAIARAVLFERLSGLPAEQAPTATHARDFQPRVAAFPRCLAPELSACLDEAAAEFLHSQGIDDEPLTWQPPPELLTDLALPGPDPTSVDIVALHQALGEPGRSFKATAERLDTTIDTIRYLLEQHPLPLVPARRQVAPRVRRKLTREEFIHFYCQQRLGLKTIARRFGVSRNVLVRLARDYGIALEGVGRKTKIPVDRDWLYEQYVDRRRTVPHLAKELGVSSTTIYGWARRYGIAMRPPGRHGGVQYVQTQFPQDTVDGAWLYEQYVNQRRSFSDLARELGVSTGTVYSWARKHRIPMRPAGPAGDPQYLRREVRRDTVDGAWLYEQYVNQHRTVDDLARELGVSNRTVSSWLRLHGVPVRPRGGRSTRQWAERHTQIDFAVAPTT